MKSGRGGGLSGGRRAVCWWEPALTLALLESRAEAASARSAQSLQFSGDAVAPHLLRRQLKRVREVERYRDIGDGRVYCGVTGLAFNPLSLLAALPDAVRRARRFFGKLEACRET